MEWRSGPKGVNVWGYTLNPLTDWLIGASLGVLFALVPTLVWARARLDHAAACHGLRIPKWLSLLTYQSRSRKLFSSHSSHTIRFLFVIGALAASLAFYQYFIAWQKVIDKPHTALDIILVETSFPVTMFVTWGSTELALRRLLKPFAH